MLLTWGRSQHHGHPDSTDIPTPRPLSTGRQIRQIACGELHTLALTADGRVLTFGSGLMGALGTGELTAAATPVEISALTQPIIDIAAGRHHSLALTRSGEVYGWGMCGAAGELELEPTRQPELGGRASAIGCGDEYCAALTPNGGVAWGGAQLGASCSTVLPAPAAFKLRQWQRFARLIDDPQLGALGTGDDTGSFPSCLRK